MGPGIVSRAMRNQPDEIESAIDESALARLEALQKRQMIAMFGVDYEQEERDKAAARQKMLEEREQKRKNALAQAARIAAAQEAGGKKKKKKKGQQSGEGAAGGAASLNAGGKKCKAEQLFELERERAAFMSSKVCKLYGHDQKKEELRGRKYRKDRPDADFMSAKRIVEELGASMFVGREKKAWETQLEAQKLKALGAKAPKNEKCPIFILKGMRAKAKDREAKQKIKDQQTGMAIKKTKKKGKSKSVMSLNTSGVMKVNPTLKASKSVGGMLKSMGRSNKTSFRG